MHPMPGDFSSVRIPVMTWRPCCLQWVEHHASLGVSKIYVWDNKSKTPMNTTLQCGFLRTYAPMGVEPRV